MEVMTMSDADHEKDREGKALDAIIGSAFMQDSCDIDDAEIDQLAKSVNEVDRNGLDKALGSDFIASLFAGVQKPAKQQRQQLATAMNRSDDDGPLSDKAKEEIERKIREAEEKRRENEQRQRDSGHDGR
jgi:hypothetical protein